MQIGLKKNTCITFLVILMLKCDLYLLRSNFYHSSHSLASCVRIDHNSVWAPLVFFCTCKDSPSNCQPHKSPLLSGRWEAFCQSKSIVINFLSFFFFFSNFCILGLKHSFNFKIHDFYFWHQRVFFPFLKKHDHILRFCLIYI